MLMEATGDFYKHMFDVRLGDVDFLWGKLKLVADWFLSARWQLRHRLRNGTTGQGHVKNSGGVGGGFVQQWDLPPSWGKLSFVQLAALYGWGLVNFDPSDVDLGKLDNSLQFCARCGWYRRQSDGRNDPFRSINPYNNSQRARANIYWVWNPTDNFSMGTWATYQFDDQGFTSFQVNDNGSISSASPYSHLFTAGIRPVYWLWGPFAIQGHSATRISRTIELQGQRSAMEVRWASSRSPRPSSPEAAFSPVLSYAPLRPSQSGLMRSRARLEVQPTPTKTTDLSLVSKLRHGFKRDNAIYPI